MSDRPEPKPQGGSQPGALPSTPSPKGCKLPGDLSTQCPTCAVEMVPIHSHYQCPRCGYRDSCCF